VEIALARGLAGMDNSLFIDIALVYMLLSAQYNASRGKVIHCMQQTRPWVRLTKPS
jgi:hypothetical protein